MDIQTVKLTQAQLDALPESQSGAYDQARCKFKASTGQWLLIDKTAEIPYAVIEIVGQPKLQPIAPPPPDIAQQFQRVLDLCYQKGNNLSKSERDRMEVCYVMGAKISLMKLEHATSCQIDAVGHKLMEDHKADVETSMRRVNGYLTR